MPTSLSASDLAGMQAAATALMPETCTIARTNVTTVCRVMTDTRQIRVQGMPSVLALPRWKIVFPDATDIRAGDSVTVTGKGTYSVIEGERPTSFSDSNLVYAVLTTPISNPNSVADPNQTVTFQRLKSDGSGYDPITGCGVYVFQPRVEPQMLAMGAVAEWQVIYQNSLTINGLQLQADDQIVWAETHRGFSVLERPQQLYGPLPYAVAVFREGA